MVLMYMQSASTIVHSTRHPLLVALGERLRRERDRRGLTRRALASAAQVSERHLANLESGLGNASILVLQQLASALQCRLAELLADAPARTQRVALIGLRGAGKSTLGARLAADLGWPFVELGREIEKLAGCSIREIHDLYGADAYRRYERRALEAVLHAAPPAVIAAPGGIVADAASYELLLEHCVTVWLQATPEDHMARVVAQGDLRPMAGHAEAMADLRRILDGRSAAYARADLRFDTSALPLGRTAAALRREVRAALDTQRVRR